MPSPPSGACAPGPSFWFNSTLNWWPWWRWWPWRRPPMASLAGFRSHTLILMVFFCILVFLCWFVLLFLRSHLRPFTEVLRKIGREVTRKNDGPAVGQRSRPRAEGLRVEKRPTPNALRLMRDRDTRARGRFQRMVVFTRITSHFPRKRMFHDSAFIE